MAARFSKRLSSSRVEDSFMPEITGFKREWVEKHYVDTKKANPQFPILIRECSNTTPKVYARYALGKENSAVLTDKSAADVGRTIEMLAKQ